MDMAGGLAYNNYIKSNAVFPTQGVKIYMKFTSLSAKLIIALICLSAFLVPSTDIMPEVERDYEQTAYQRLLEEMATAVPSPSPTPDPLSATSSAAPATAIPSPTPQPEPVYTLPMDTYDGGVAPAEANYSTSEIVLNDGTTVTAQVYSDPTIEVTYYVQRYYESDCNLVFVKIKHPSQLRTAISEEAVGGAYAKTSEMGRIKNAVVAINGEYYTQRESTAFIVKQSDMIKSTPSEQLHQLIIDTSGNFHITTTAEDSRDMVTQLQGQIYQAFSFGPALVIDGQKVEYTDYHFDADSPNPRNAIGQTGELEYLICTANGRTDTDEGLDIAQLADVMAQNGCQNAYNLDGGGSCTLYWHGDVVSHVNTSDKEREISDCIYFASAYTGE